jgi:hypothetical protein
MDSSASTMLSKSRDMNIALSNTIFRGKILYIRPAPSTRCPFSLSSSSSSTSSSSSAFFIFLYFEIPFSPPSNSIHNLAGQEYISPHKSSNMQFQVFTTIAIVLSSVASTNAAPGITAIANAELHKRTCGTLTGNALVLCQNACTAVCVRNTQFTSHFRAGQNLTHDLDCGNCWSCQEALQHRLLLETIEGEA